MNYKKCGKIKSKQSKKQYKEKLQRFQQQRQMNKILFSSNNESLLKKNDVDKKENVDIRSVLEKRVFTNKKQQIFYNYLKQHNIGQIVISTALQRFSRIKHMYGLQDYKDNSAHCLYFGVYNTNDIQHIRSHKGKSYVMFGGTDCDSRYSLSVKTINELNKLENITYIAQSKDIENRLNEHNIKCTYIDLNLVNYDIFKPINQEKERKCIYVYDGQGKILDFKKHVYNYAMIEEVKRKLPEYEYIHSSSLGQVPYEQMPSVYEKCFIGLRLTDNDGNANTVQEFEAMGIPIVHNQSEYGLKWKTVDDIIAHVKRNIKSYKQSFDILDEHRYNMYQLNSLSIEQLSNINTNITNFDKILDKYNKILFICGDYPGYGGAATNCHELLKYYQQQGHNVYGFYFNYEKGINAKYETHKDYIIDDLKNIHKITFNPDLVILKSPIGINIKKHYHCPVYYLVGGIYTNKLDKYYYDIDVNEQKKYVNATVINQSKTVDKVFVNSSHTQEILREQFNVTSHLFYSSFVPFTNKEPIIDNNFNNRKYDYALIVSNFDRKIKNVKESIEFLKDKDNVILIGKNSGKYKEYGFECVDLVDKEKMDEYYKQIKYIVQDSFYESCSNVKIEGLFNGCRMYNIYFINVNNTIVINNKEILNVVFCCDCNYMYYSMFALISCIDNSQHNNKIRYTFCVPIEDIDLCENFLREINKIYNYALNIRIYGVNIKNKLDNLQLIKHGGHLNSKGNYLRLALNKVLPYDSYIYIDSDDIVMKDIYTSFKSLNIDDKTSIYGRKSETTFGVIVNKQHHSNIKNLVEKNIDLNNKIINTGTYYINCKRTNELSIIKDYDNILNIHKEINLFRCFTMSIINLAHYDSYDYFDESKFNCVIDLGWKTTIPEYQLNNATVLEWSGNKKPWKKDGLYKQYWYPYFPLKLKKNIILIISHPLNSVGGSQNFIKYAINNTINNSYNGDTQFVCCYKYKNYHETNYLKFNLDNEVLFDFINHNKIKSIIFNNSIWNFNNNEIAFFNKLSCKKKLVCHNEYSPAIHFLDKMNFTSVIGVNKSIKRKLKNKVPVIEVIPISTKIDNFYINITKKYTKSFAYIGRIDKYKGIDTILKVFNKLILNDKDYKLYIISPIRHDNDIYINLLKFVNNNGLNNNIIFTKKKSVSELIEFCKINVNYIISGSITEGYPVICHESIQMTCPIISTDVGGFKDFVNEFKWGYLINLEKYYKIENILDLNFVSSFEIFNKVSIKYQKYIINEFIKTIKNITQDKYTSLLKKFDVNRYFNIMNKNNENIIKAFK